MDDDTLREATTRQLKTRGYSVIPLATGRDVIEVLTFIRPAVIVTISGLLCAVFAVGCGSRTIDDGYLDDWRTDAGALPVDSGATDAVVVDTATVEPPDGVRCGSTECTAGSEECCLTMGGASCVAIGACRGASLTCSSTASCSAGKVCCFRVGGAGGRAACEGECNGRGAFRLCESDAECMMGQRCRDLPGGVRGCR